VVSRNGAVRIASRGSQLALWQAEWVGARLAERGVRSEIEVIRTTGDRILDVPLARIGDRGLFTKEIDEALLEARAELAVHSLKDVPTRVPEGLVIAAVTEREDPRDVLISRQGTDWRLETLPAGARVGTSSLRRRSQLRRMRPDVEVLDLRGNLNTRLAKLDAGEYDAIILAAAGVVRLGWQLRISQILPVDLWLPAVGQGALGVMVRSDDDATRELIADLHHPGTAAAVGAERSFLRALEGGCQVPIGAAALLDGDRLSLDGFVADLEGDTMLRERHEGPALDPAAVGTELAARLVARGASDILREIRLATDLPGVPAP
jgi:hydroxymethylbilane synthase